MIFRVETPKLLESSRKYTPMLRLDSMRRSFSAMPWRMICPVLLAQRLLKKKKLQRGSSVVFTSSIGGVMISTVGNTMYGVSKGGLNAFMKGFALEMAVNGIRSNSVNPGFVATSILSAGTISEEQLKQNMAHYPLGRFGKPEDIAYAIIYLLSDASSWVTGHTLVVDGGVILK